MIQLSDESQIEFQDTGDSDSEDDELEVLKAQDDDSKDRLQKGERVFRNSIIYGQPSRM